MDISKKSNVELQGLKKELKDEYESVRMEVLRVYDYWESLKEDYIKVDSELKNRGLL
jgi:hypothetical protein